MSMTPKEALAKDGFPVKMGKGRLSLAAIERCKALAVKGWDIKGYSVTAAPVTKENATPAPIVTKAKPGNVKEVLEYTILYEKDAYKAVGRDNKVYGMAEVCNTCRVSLVQNQCLTPTILGGIPVKIVPR